MLITFKTLQQKSFKVEIEEAATVKALKEKIAQERGNEFPVEGQKLIYAGRILDDDKPISEYNIDVIKNFVVVMAVKPKPKPVEKVKEETTSTSPESTSTSEASSRVTSTSSSAEATAAVSVGADTTSRQASVSDTTSSSTVTTTSSVTSSVEPDNILLTGSALETSIQELMALGFTRQQVEQALHSSFNNADRAAEYLLSGNIPEVTTTDTTPAAPDQEAVSIPSAGATTEVGDLSFLRSLPQFQMMRRQLQRNPEQLPQLLQEIGQANPQLLTLISQNQEAFINILNEQDSTEQGAGAGGTGGAGGAGGGGGGGSGYQVQVSSEEKTAIERMVAMGFDESDVIQAFFACEKNEQLTLNFLLSEQYND